MKPKSEKVPRKLLERILRESKNSVVFAGPAQDAVIHEITSPTSWPFVGTLLGLSTESGTENSPNWTARWTLTYTRSGNHTWKQRLECGELASTKGV